MSDTPIDILIVEDEVLLAMDLSDTLTEQGYRVVGVAHDGPSALELFERQPVDLLLCDINLPGPFNGLEVVKLMKAIRPVPVVYLTAYADKTTFALARATNPFAYLVKPYQLGSLRSAIELAFHQFNEQRLPPKAPSTDDELNVINRDTIFRLDEYLFIKQEYIFIKLALQDILFIEVDGNYIVLLTQTRRYPLRMALAVFLDKVAYPRLVRTHRSYAVNITHLDSFGEHELTIQGHVIPISRQFRKAFLDSFTIR